VGLGPRLRHGRDSRQIRHHERPLGVHRTTTIAVIFSAALVPEPE